MKTICLALVLALSGCATFESVDNVQRGSPRIFAGTRLDMAAIQQDEATLRHFRRYEMNPPDYPRADVIFSFAADVLVLPLALGYSLTEPLLYLR